MSESEKPEVIALHDKLKPLIDDVVASANDIQHTRQNNIDLQGEMNGILASIRALSEAMDIPVDLPEPQTISELSINEIIDASWFAYEPQSKKTSVFPNLSTEELIFASVAGLISVVIDVVFVGTPEIVKLYKQGERFDGSVLTGLLRKIGVDGNGNLAPIFEWLSEKCKVPYDISAAKGIMSPNDHRLKSLAHDPFFGLFFAVADILLGTTTCIGSDGNLTVLISKKPADTPKKLMAVFFYIGHILSDLCTARGIPIPGAFLTQFFTAEGTDSSLAQIANRMYRDGYDIRHMASMAVPVAIKDLLITAYLSISSPVAVNPAASIAELEYAEIQEKLKREKMLFISNSVATVGNVVKLVAPPNCGNPAAINASQWFAMIQSSFNMLHAAARDRTPETIIETRNAINSTWKALLEA